MTTHIKTIHPMKYMRDFLAQKVRPDGRNLKETRPTAVNVGSIKTADGSAVMKLGHTVVICGIKAEMCIPPADAGNKGIIVPNIELSPLCSSRFKYGPPSELAQTYNQFIADVILNANSVDLEQLVICPGKLIWVLYCDLICLDFDGSVLDAAVACLYSALKTVSLPQVNYDPINKSKTVNLEKRTRLKVLELPVSSTFATFDEDIILTDPTGEEEDLSGGVVTIVTCGEKLCCVHKPGGCRITDNLLEQCISNAFTRTKQVIQMVNISMQTVL